MQSRRLIKVDDLFAKIDAEDEDSLTTDYLNAGNDINICDSKGVTLLMYAIKTNKTKIIKFLLNENNRKRINVNQKDHTNKTAGSYLLLYYFSGTRKEVFNLLKEAGASYYDVELVYIVSQLNYDFSYLYKKGYCFGLSIVARDYISRGPQGIKELSEIFNILREIPAKTLVNNLKKAEQIRQAFVIEYRKVINSKIKKQFAPMSSSDRYKIVEKAEKNRNYKIIDKIVKNKFVDVSYQERKVLVHKIIKYINGEIPHPEYKKIIKKIFPNLLNEIAAAQIQFLTQHILDIQIKEQLRKENIDLSCLDLPNFLQNVFLSQESGVFFDYKDTNPIFPSRFSFSLHNQLQMFPLVSSIDVENKSIFRQNEADSFGYYDVNELDEFFTYWLSLLKRNQFKNPVNFFFSTESHQFLVSYIPESNQWVFQNTTVMELIPENNTVELAKLVTIAAGAKNTDSIVCLESRVFVAGNDAPNLKHLTKQLEEGHPLTEFNSSTSQNRWDIELHTMMTRSTNANRIQKLSDARIVATNPVESAIALTVSILLLPVIALAAIPLLGIGSIPLFGIVLTVAIGAFLDLDRYFHKYVETDEEKEKKNAANDETLACIHHDRKYIDCELQNKISHQNDKQPALQNPDKKTKNDAIFSQAHLSYLEIKHKWERIWLIDPFSDKLKKEREAIFSVSRCGLFKHETGKYREYHRKIELILTDKFDEDKSEDRLNEINSYIDLMLNCEGFKKNMPTSLVTQLEELRRITSEVAVKENISQTVHY